MLIGRDSEFAALNHKVQALVRGEGGIVALTGEPGLGKSRLVAEAKRHAADNRLLWLEGRALSFGHNLSYWPFIEILKRCFAIDEDDTEEHSWSKLEHGVRALFADGTPGILPYGATVLALRVPAQYEDRIKFLDTQALGRQVFLSMRQLFERMARRQPIVDHREMQPVLPARAFDLLFDGARSSVSANHRYLCGITLKRSVCLLNEPVENAPKECRGRPITYQCA